MDIDFNHIKEKSFQLLKELIIESAQGAGEQIASEIKLAEELYCQINGYDIEEYDRLYQEMIDILNELFPRGYSTSKEWKVYRIHLSTLIDNIDKELAGTQV